MLNVDQLQPLIDIDEQQIKTIIETSLQVDQATSWVVTASERAPYWLVDDNNSLTAAVIQSGGYCQLVSEITRKDHWS